MVASSPDVTSMSSPIPITSLLAGTDAAQVPHRRDRYRRASFVPPCSSLLRRGQLFWADRGLVPGVLLGPYSHDLVGKLADVAARFLVSSGLRPRRAVGHSRCSPATSMALSIDASSASHLVFFIQRSFHVLTCLHLPGCFLIKCGAETVRTSLTCQVHEQVQRVAGDAMNIVLDPIFMFVFQYGISGAAVAHVISQYSIAAILLWRLRLHVELFPPSLKHLQIGRFLKNGFLLLARVIAATCCIWLASSLLADGLAFAAQAILASAFARRDQSKATATASRVLQLGMVLGVLLSILLGVGLRVGSRLFTENQDVLHHIYVATPFVALTQPINALAFVFDGVNYGASDFAYAAYSMILVAIASIICILAFTSYSGFIGIWIALSIYMCLRMFAGFLRIGTARGPWAFLRD
ncbi:hypothetical protein ACQ4PT_049225 [Festuca glaucescens]